MHPDELAVQEQHRFVSSAVGDRPRVLEVGCGRGELARRLAGDGHAVTAVDRALGAAAGVPGVTFVERDFLELDGGRFDAIVFTASLHHVHPLARAIDHAAALLAPGGVLVVDDFDVEVPGTATSRWFYETLDLLAEVGLIAGAEVEGTPDDEPGARWRAEHAHDPPLATGAQMLAAIRTRVPVRQVERGPYLYRYFCHSLPGTEHSGAIAQHLLAHEHRRIRDGSLDAVGLRVVAG